MTAMEFSSLFLASLVWHSPSALVSRSFSLWACVA